MNLGELLGLAYFAAAVSMVWRRWWFTWAFLMGSGFHAFFLLHGRPYDPDWYADWMPRAAAICGAALLAAAEMSWRLSRQFAPPIRFGLRCSLVAFPAMVAYGIWRYAMNHGADTIDWFKAIREAFWAGEFLAILVAVLFCWLFGSLRGFWQSLPMLWLFADYAIVGALTPATGAEYRAMEWWFRVLALVACLGFVALPPYGLAEPQDFEPAPTAATDRRAWPPPPRAAAR